jgi:hypothetical protein
MVIFILLIIYRLEIQTKVRQSGQNPCSTDQVTIDTAREQLSILLSELKKVMHIAGVVEGNGQTNPSNEPLAMWDEILNEPIPSGSGSKPADVPSGSGSKPVVVNNPGSNNAPPPKSLIQIEDQLIPLPSNGNVASTYGQLELTHRISRADLHLNRIRDLIAEKSFQYSHVIRVSPRKGVNTHSRVAVKKLNLQISIQCRLYTQCRSRMVSLGADSATLNRFRTLTTEDIKASTAIVNPNEPGSTRLKLSWIWQTAGGHRLGLAAGSDTSVTGSDYNVMECKFFYYLFFAALTGSSQFAGYTGSGLALKL